MTYSFCSRPVCLTKTGSWIGEISNLLMIFLHRCRTQCPKHALRYNCTFHMICFPRSPRLWKRSLVSTKLIMGWGPSISNPFHINSHPRVGSGFVPKYLRGDGCCGLPISLLHDGQYSKTKFDMIDGQTVNTVGSVRLCMHMYVPTSNYIEHKIYPQILTIYKV